MAKLNTMYKMYKINFKWIDKLTIIYMNRPVVIFGSRNECEKSMWKDQKRTEVVYEDLKICAEKPLSLSLSLCIYIYIYYPFHEAS